MASEVVDIQIGAGPITIVGKNKTFALEASVYPTDTSIPYEETITWTSSNPEVVSVVSGPDISPLIIRGTLTGHKLGYATITVAASNGVTAECEVQVDVLIESITIEQAEATIAVSTSVDSDKYTPDVTVVPEDFTEPFYYSSDDYSVATWDENGFLINARDLGRTTLYLESQYTGNRASIIINVVPVLAESIKCGETNFRIPPGVSKPINFTVLPENALDAGYTLQSSDTSVATVSGNTVTGVEIGMATITAVTTSGLTATCVVTVAIPLPESIALNKTASQMYTGETEQLTATILPIGADKTLIWDASNGAATVSNGLITAVADGYVIIRATTANGLTASCAVTIIDKIDIFLNKSDLNLQVGETERLIATIKPDDANKKVNWLSNNNYYATVDDGLVSAVKKGSAVITAINTQGYTATCNVTVRDFGEITQDYADAIANNRRGMWDAVVTVGGSNVIPREKIGKITLHEILFQDSKIGIGAVVSSYVEIEFRKTTMKLSNRTLTFKIGMTIGDTVEYIQFGKFYVTDVEGNEDDETRTVTAFDSIKKTSRKYKTDLTYPSTAKKVAQEIAENCGLSFADGTAFPDVAIPKKIKAKTCRDVLKTITQLTGCNLVANRASKLEFRWLAEKGITISAQDRYYDFKKSDMDSYIRMVKCTNANGEFEALQSGYIDDNGMDIIFTNPYGNQSTVDSIMSKNRIDYRAGELSFLGDPSIQVGDILKIVDTKEKTYKYPVMENVIEYDGGVKNATVAYGETEEGQEFVAENKTVDEKINEVEENANNRLDTVETTTNDINDFISGTGSGGGFSEAVDNAANKAVLSSGLKAVSVTKLPTTADSNTIYLIQEVKTT